jgi:hypothetical protein
VKSYQPKEVTHDGFAEKDEEKHADGIDQDGK